jgi:hypothetical protein
MRARPAKKKRPAMPGANRAPVASPRNDAADDPIGSECGTACREQPGCALGGGIDLLCVHRFSLLVSVL